MKLKIKVTKEILEASKLCSTEPLDFEVGKNCAVALAVREIFPNAWVRTDSIEPFGAHIKNEYKFKIHLPEEAIDFIREFDESNPSTRIQMNPIEFEVDIPQAVINNIDISQLDLSKSKTLELI